MKKEESNGDAFKEKKYPILEFDPAERAIIEPSDVVKEARASEYCVISFDRATVEKVAEDYKAKVVFEDRGVYGSNAFYQFEYNDRQIVFFSPIIGASLAGGFLEEAIALGCRKFVACGTSGVLSRDIAVGHIIVPDEAIRDEGLSYHYLPPGRAARPGTKAFEAIVSTLEEQKVPHIVAKTWTTDGLFRETPGKIKRRKDEGCLTVEMEAAALFAVAEFRKVELGMMLSGCDDVSGQVWDKRAEVSRASIPERLFWLSVEACLKI